MGLVKYCNPLHEEKHSFFVEGFCRKALVPQRAAGLNDFQLSAEESEGMWSLSSAVSNRKAHPETHGEFQKGFDVAAVPSSVPVLPRVASGWLCLYRPVWFRPFWNSPWVSGWC